MATNVVVNSVMENDDIVYDDCKPDPKPEPKPEPEDKCCEKSYTIVLHFH